MRLDHLLSKEYMSLDRACAIATAYKLSRPQTLLSRREVTRAKESTDHLDRMAGGAECALSLHCSVFEGTKVPDKLCFVIASRIRMDRNRTECPTKSA